MAFAPVLEIPDQGMIPKFLAKSSTVNQVSDNSLEGYGVIATFDHAFKVLFKPVCKDGCPHQISSFLNMSSASLHSSRPLPASLSRKVFRVSAFGISTMN